MKDQISPDQFHQADGVEDWRVLSEGATALFRTPSYAAAARFVDAVAALDGVDEQRPSIDIRHDAVTVRLLTRTDDFWGMTTRDVDMARRISAVARDQSLTADTSAVQTMIVIPGAPDTAAVMPFWRAALGYVPRGDSPDEDLVDPHGLGPGFWFEPMDEPRGDGGGAIHVGVWVGREHAEARVAAALAAGGRVVRDNSPSWWTLADAAGNEIDIATTSGRD